MSLAILLTCEHASCAIPGPYREAFSQKMLASHRGYDLGALDLARVLSQGLQAPLIYGMWSRLLVDLNRSVTHPKLTSLKNVSPQNKQLLIQEYYLPFREEVGAAIQRLQEQQANVLHISVHSFTRVLAKERRDADVGILYDPSRKGERFFANIWKKNLRGAVPKVRLNYPYKGVSDGHTTSLRRLFSENHYFGFELEVCNDQLQANRYQMISKWILDSLMQSIPAFTAAQK